jgi:hypothetical protein
MLRRVYVLFFLELERRKVFLAGVTTLKSLSHYRGGSASRNG